MITIKAHIRHGECDKILQATGESVSECIIKLASENNYIQMPNFSTYSERLIKDLEATGKGAMGWVDYKVEKIMTNTFSPGPWKALKSAMHPTNGVEVWSCIQTPNIAFDLTSPAAMPVAEHDANARLIASAPELLAALEQAAKQFDFTVVAMAQGHTVSINSLQNCAAMAKSAIAKARGQT